MLLKIYWCPPWRYMSPACSAIGCKCPRQRSIGSLDSTKVSVSSVQCHWMAVPTPEVDREPWFYKGVGFQRVVQSDWSAIRWKCPRCRWIAWLHIQRRLKIWLKLRLFIGPEPKITRSDWSRGSLENVLRGYTYCF